MGATYTPNAKLGVPTVGTTGYTSIIQADMTALDGMAPVGGLCVTTHEQPSTTLNVDIAAGAYVKQDGTIGTFAGAASQAMAASTTTYLWLTGVGVLTTGAAWPAAGTAYVPLAVVVAGATTITSVTDKRACFPIAGIAYLPLAGGTLADGANLAVGSTTGTQIGTAATQKLGFFGHAPAAQPTMGAATAGASYTTNEQTMLQAVYNAVRALGLGS